MHGSHRRWLLAAFAAVCLAVTFAACGSSDDSSSSTSGGSGSTAAADSGDGGAKKVDEKTIGWVDGTLAGSFQQRIYQAGKDAIEHVGWKVKTVDTKGDPAAAASGVSSLVNSGVDGIIMSAVTPSTARAGLLQAKAKKIPVLMVGSAVDDSLDESLDLTYIGGDEVALTRPLGDLMVSRLRRGDTVGMLTTTALASAVQRTDALKAQLEEAGIRVATPLETGFDFTAGVRNASSLLNQNADLTAIVPIFDLWTAATVSAIKSAKKPVKVYSFYADAVNTPLMRKNPQIIDGLTDGTMISASYVAVDRLLDHFANDAEISADGVEPYEYAEITTETLPPGNQNGPVSQADAARPFYEKWATEYGVPAN
jgi:ABC-type sugar transport system substrate-binding protein